MGGPKHSVWSSNKCKKSVTFVILGSDPPPSVTNVTLFLKASLNDVFNYSPQKSKPKLVEKCLEEIRNIDVLAKY